MVITAHIDKWEVMRVLVDNGSQEEILFLSTFQQMGFDRKQLKEAPKPLYDFGERKIESIGSVSIPVSFGSLHNARTENITFDVVEMNYPYNAMPSSKGVSSIPSKQRSTPFTSAKMC
jgi:hypothetical protein